MKNIELTEDHKSKLLEMCKILFPKNNIKFTDDYYCESSLFLVSEDENFDMNIKDMIDIHWFEFCVLDLATKLYNLNKRDEICKIELYRGDLIQNYHPVEYLYEEYQYYLKTK